MEGMERRRIADRLVAGAAFVVVAAVAVDAVRGHRSAAPPPSPPPPTTTTAAQVRVAPVPVRIRLVPSSTAFMRACVPARARLALAPGPRLVLRYEGPPCHLAPLALRAVVRWHDAKRLYDGPATARDALAGNYADGLTADARLVGPASVCGGHAVISGAGLVADGTIVCR